MNNVRIQNGPCCDAFTTETAEFFLREGLGGAADFGVSINDVAGSGWLVKNVSILVLSSPPSVDGTPMRTRASRLDS